ncbi:FMN reductase (NADPH) [Dermatophilus congolensis]|uniref:FMN reductase (NADPH) n=1 Tax=Dermatophilus congolensis TaxID=1863 RepID=A0AA46H180_9MICO|nr:NAD(P)H-dependent oxidoreductase [Dermatophilus congolensis]STD13865.1 FMN reductase (NADPH) [Dermatophilus congolensis]
MSKVIVVSAGHKPQSTTERLAVEIATSLDGKPACPATSHVALSMWGSSIAAGLVTCDLSPELVSIRDDLGSAEGIVVVTPVHHASYSALFKAFFDQLPRGILAGIPTLMAASGGSGRDALILDMALRPYLAALRMLVTPTGIMVAPEDRNAQGVLLPSVSDRIDRATAEFVALLGHRANQVKGDCSPVRDAIGMAC